MTSELCTATCPSPHPAMLVPMSSRNVTLTFFNTFTLGRNRAGRVNTTRHAPPARCPVPTASQPVPTVLPSLPFGRPVPLACCEGKRLSTPLTEYLYRARTELGFLAMQLWVKLSILHPKLSLNLGHLFPNPVWKSALIKNRCSRCFTDTGT